MYCFCNSSDDIAGSVFQGIGFMPSSTTSWTSASSLFPVCHYWTNWLIQVCLTSVVTTTIRHIWINQVCPLMETRRWLKFRK